MSLTLYFHPLSSYCWKALIGLYELGLPFEKRLVDLQDAKEAAAFRELWPIGKFPVLRDDDAKRTVPESTLVLEYAERLAPAGARLLPTAPERALDCRLRDRVFDLYIHNPMQQIVANRLRPEDKRDALGVDAARAQIRTAYGLVENQIAEGPWSLGGDFTLADCAAMPALYYANKVAPLGEGFPKTTAYLARLCERPSVRRVLEEAAPYFAMFPQ